MIRPVLYGLARSVYTRIARLAFEEKKIEYKLEEVEIFGPDGVPPAHFERHPFGRIPVLQHGDFRLYETSAITRYVDERFFGPALQPQEPEARGRMGQIIGVLDAYGYRPMVWGIFVQRVRLPLQGKSTDEAEVVKALPIAAKCLDVLDLRLSATPFLAGHRCTLADLHAAPMLIYLALAPDGRLLISQRPRLEAWLESMKERPSLQRTKTVYE